MLFSGLGRGGEWGVSKFSKVANDLEKVGKPKFAQLRPFLSLALALCGEIANFGVLSFFGPKFLGVQKMVSAK